MANNQIENKQLLWKIWFISKVSFENFIPVVKYTHDVEKQRLNLLKSSTTFFEIIIFS